MGNKKSKNTDFPLWSQPLESYMFEKAEKLKTKISQTLKDFETTKPYLNTLSREKNKRLLDYLESIQKKMEGLNPILDILRKNENYEKEIAPIHSRKGILQNPIIGFGDNESPF